MPLVSQNVDTFPHLAVADCPIDDEGLPFDSNFFRYSVPVAIKHVGGTSDEVLASPGEHHGRSYELLLSPEARREVWKDRFGNPYTALTTKGNNFSDAKLYKSGTAPSGFLPYGLQEGDALLRVLRASQVMREAGIDTEWIVRVEEPKKLAYKGQLYEPAEFRRRLISDLVAQSAFKGVGVKTDAFTALSLEEVNEIRKALDGMDFFVTLRSMATPVRVLDVVNESYYNH